MSQRVAVIGSGLSAIGAIRALRARGIRPTVIDRGERLDEQCSAKVESMVSREPAEWTTDERRELLRNPSLKDGSVVPKKLIFGSDYFYGKSKKEAPVVSVGNLPPFSYALGGLSSGWGAAVLPPQGCDLNDWPFGPEELETYCAKLLADLPYSAMDDGLSLDFPLLSSRCNALCPSRSDRSLLAALESASIMKEGETVFGQARLLVDASRGEFGCRYCGQCMAGCVYGAIYKAGDEIIRLQRSGDIDYIQGHFVQRLAEEDGKVIVTSLDADGITRRLSFDRVFLAAGGVNSARITLESLGLFGRKVRLLSRGGFVIPMLTLRRMQSDWPKCNTQPGLFMELKGKGLEHWVHVQISTENELLLQKLGLDVSDSGLLARIKRFIASHVVLLFVNYHSDHAGWYEIWLEAAEEYEKASRLHSSHHKAFPERRVWVASWMRLLSVFVRVGCLPFFPLAKLNTGAYHVGGTLPMKLKPSDKLETDILGRLPAWNKIHVVDTATFPSLPGTTIGLLTMANAYRIVDKVDWDEEVGEEV